MADENSITIIGDSTLSQTSDSPVTRKLGPRWHQAETYEGTWQDVVDMGNSLKDKPGPDDDETSVYSSIEVTRLPGDRGRIVVVIETVPATVSEVVWTPVEKPLSSHPVVGFAKPNSSGEIEYDTDAIDHFERWKTAPLSRKLQYQYPVVDNPDPENPDHWLGLSPEEKPIAVKTLAGVETYYQYAPNISRTSYSRTKPETGGCGKISEPPEDIKVAGYVYLKTDDRVQQQQDGIWQRTQMWTGAEYWDTDLYEKETDPVPDPDPDSNAPEIDS